MDEEQRNRMLAGGLLALTILVAAWASFTVLNATSYERYRIQGDLDDAFCEQYYEACTCYGDLVIRESYPEQFDCSGVEICHDINRTTCPTA